MSQALEIRGGIPAIVRNDEGFYEGDLESYFRKFFFHAQNHYHPYHNFRHSCHVMWLCYQASRYYRGALTKRKRRSLLIAALFHDFDHTGKTGPDSINIERALTGLQAHLLPEDKWDFKHIADFIKATEYPHTVSSNKLSLPAQILRDTDLGQTLNPVWLQQTIFGLAAEWGKSPLEVLRMQEPFLTKLEFLTDWARELFPQSVIQEKIAETRELLEILDG